jgi:phosphoribosylformylglycinamidine (FGAM) synthase-like enzyme
MGLIGSELYRMTREDSSFPLAHGISETNIGLPNWEAALKLYSWIGQDSPLHREIHSIHDISEGGLLVALSEGLFARNFGITISNPTENKTEEDIYNFLYGEGFHSFIVSINPSVSEKMKNEWSEKNISHFHLGTLNQSGILKVNGSGANQGKSFQCHTKNLFKAWSREGYFE